MPTEKDWPYYKGELLKPIGTPSQRDGLIRDDSGEEFREHWMAAVKRKMPLLFQHYGIEDHNDWRLLALSLAYDHVPGMRLGPLSGKKPGRKRVWTPEVYCCLLATVLRIRRDRSCGDSEACQIISSHPRYHNAPWNAGGKRQDKRSLENRLSEARNVRHNPYLQFCSPEAQPNEDEMEGQLRAAIFKSYDPHRNHDPAKA